MILTYDLNSFVLNFLFPNSRYENFLGFSNELKSMGTTFYLR